MNEENLRYFETMKAGIEEAYELANSVRRVGFDPERKVEAIPAGDLAARVEGLVGPVGVAEKIREIGKENVSQIVDQLINMQPGMSDEQIEEQVDQALRTSLAILTEGVVAAPIEGISHVKIKSNPDGSRYLSVYFSGPIRSAGGTAQGLAVLCADYIRRKYELQEYRPTNDEIERYVEEIKLYNERAARLQYKPSDNDIRTIVRSANVCIDGDPTEKIEVSIHRDLERIETNRVRGGMCLVSAEGVAQKARKIMKYAEKFNLDWSWLETLGKDRKEEDDVKSVKRFMEEIVGGRPIFSAPSAKGGFRLRYGRSRSGGIMAKSVHPAVMILLDSFIATGTQIKVEHPGKGCVVTGCETIEPPIAKLKDNSVIRVETLKQALEARENLKEVLFLGDMLVSFNDFLQTNNPLLPAGYCEEEWLKDLKARNVEPQELTKDDVVEFSLTNGVPLHPRYTYYWSDVSASEIRKLVNWLSTGELTERGLEVRGTSPEAKRVLEVTSVTHDVTEDKVIIHEWKPLLSQLGLLQEGRLDNTKFNALASEVSEGANGLELVQKVSAVKIKDKSGTYIGARMGRPEKAKPRKMQPAVHALFPVGEAGGRLRSINTASEENTIEVDVASFVCPRCELSSDKSSCPSCGEKTIQISSCRCGWKGKGGKCPSCGSRTWRYSKKNINIKELWKKAIERVGKVAEVKGVIGMISEYKIPEPLEKGLLRAIHEIFVFKDGTVRYDATNVPLTHFKPKEIGTSVEKLKELGYSIDYYGKPIENEDQVIELRVQDVIIPKSGGEYLLKTTRFIDDLLVKLYGKEKYYKLDDKEGLVGQLIMGLAPHTSAGVTGRIIGFTRANVCFAHPYWHQAKRRDADGDEDAFMLLLDALMNFSRKFLPETRGGKMDAPLVVITKLDPNEVDDQVHKMEIVSEYPDDFYEKTRAHAKPGEAGIKTVGDVLETNPYSDIKYTHDTDNVVGPVVETQYVKLKKMKDKVEAQLKVAEKIRAVDEREVAELVLNAHFMKDTYGNLRTFSRQSSRCVKCNHIYRRVPLNGKCNKCGGKLLLTVSEGSIRKYVGISKDIAEQYNLSDYIKQRLHLIENDLQSLFTNDLDKQSSLADYM